MLPILVFPGQGAQAVGMGKDLCAALPEVRQLFEHADRLLEIPLSRTIFEGPEEALVDTAIQQPALVLMGLAVAKAVEVRTGRPLACAAAAGLSLGEYAALCAAGALSFEDTLRLVRRRGELMKEASARVPCGMAVVLKLSPESVQKACAEAAAETGEVVSPCNFNGGDQIVIGGSDRGLALAMEKLKAAGARRVMRLPVAGAFHTALMQPAADGLREALARTPIAPAKVPVYANVSGLGIREPEAIRSSLVAQLTSPVLWEQSVNNMAAAGHTRFLELGPGRTLSNMIAKILPQSRTESLGTWEQVQAFAG